MMAWSFEIDSTGAVLLRTSEDEQLLNGKDLRHMANVAESMLTLRRHMGIKDDD